MHIADEKAIFAYFKMFLREEFIDKADMKCQPGSISTPGLLRIFLIQRGWASYYGIPEGER